jgi:predicted transcriptional regulator
VTRDDRQRQHIYDAGVSKKPTLNAIVRKWIDKTFAGSSAALAMQVLDAKRPRREELVRLRALIRAMEKREGKA